MSAEEPDALEISELTKGSRMVPLASPLNLFAIDLRSLAAFRISLASILLIDLGYRARDLRFFYTDDGVLPRLEAIRVGLGSAVSFHMMSGAWEMQAVLFLLAAAAHFCLLIGYRTRTATVLSWLFLLSLQRRNFQVLQGGDDLTRLLVIWGCFLPLGARWSVDSSESKPDGKITVRSIASAALLSQTVMVYVFSAMLKSGAAWRTEGTAVAMALKLDQFTKPFGYFLLEYPGLLHFMSLSVWRLEMYGPFLAFIPVFNPFFRFLTAFIFIGFHFGLFLSMELGPFPFVCMTAWLPFLPTEFWDRLLPRSRTAPLENPPPKRKRTKTEMAAFAAKHATALAAFLIVLAWNIRGMNFTKWQKYFPQDYNYIAQGPGLEQYWSMFSPYPLTMDGWYVIVGKTVSNRTINLTPNANPDDPILDEKPQRVSEIYPTERWRKYMMNLAGADNQAWRPFFMIALAKRWNRAHPNDMIKSIDMYYWIEHTKLDGPEAQQKQLLWHYESGLK